MYRLRLNGEIKSKDEIKAMYENTSFPDVWNSALVENLGLDPVLESPIPITTRYQVAIKDGVEQNENGQWFWKWAVVDVEDSVAQAIDEDQAKAVRETRNKLLLECDWVVIKAYEYNEPVPAEWESYRQQLRDLPQQTGFPWEITWPDKP